MATTSTRYNLLKKKAEKGGASSSELAEIVDYERSNAQPESSQSNAKTVDWNLSSWTDDNGNWTSQPSLKIGDQTYKFNTPKEYIDKLTELKSSGTITGSVDKYISEFQDAQKRWDTSKSVSSSENPGYSATYNSPIVTEMFDYKGYKFKIERGTGDASKPVKQTYVYTKDGKWEAIGAISQGSIQARWDREGRTIVDNLPDIGYNFSSSSQGASQQINDQELNKNNYAELNFTDKQKNQATAYMVSDSSGKVLGYSLNKDGAIDYKTQDDIVNDYNATFYPEPEKPTASIEQLADSTPPSSYTPPSVSMSKSDIIPGTNQTTNNENMATNTSLSDAQIKQFISATGMSSFPGGWLTWGRENINKPEWSATVKKLGLPTTSSPAPTAQQAETDAIKAKVEAARQAAAKPTPSPTMQTESDVLKARVEAARQAAANTPAPVVSTSDARARIEAARQSDSAQASLTPTNPVGGSTFATNSPTQQTLINAQNAASIPTPMPTVQKEPVVTNQPAVGVSMQEQQRLNQEYLDQGGSSFTPVTDTYGTSPITTEQARQEITQARTSPEAQAAATPAPVVPTPMPTVQPTPTQAVPVTRQEQQQANQQYVDQGGSSFTPVTDKYGASTMTPEQGIEQKIQPQRDVLTEVQNTPAAELTFEQKILAERIRQNRLLQADPTTLSPEDRITRERIVQNQQQKAASAVQNPATTTIPTEPVAPEAPAFSPEIRPEVGVSSTQAGAATTDIRSKLAEGYTSTAQSQAPAAVAPATNESLISRAQAIGGATPAQVAPTMPEVSDAIAAEQQRQQPLLDYLSRKPAESATDRLIRLNKEAGRPELIQTRQQTLEAITKINNLLQNVERGVQLRGQDVGITAQQGNRLGQQEAKPLTQQSQALNNTLSLVNQSIADVDQSVAQFQKAGQEDQANELQRLTQLAAQPGMTQTQQADVARQIEEQTKIASEQRAFTQSIAKDLLNQDQTMQTEQLKSQYDLAIQYAKNDAEAAKLTAEYQKDVMDRFNTGIDKLRTFALNEGIITDKFTAGVAEAQRRLLAGEDPETILSDIAASVASNTTLQEKFKAELKRTQQLAKATSGSSKSSTSSVDEEIQSVFLDTIGRLPSTAEMKYIQSKNPQTPEEIKIYSQQFKKQSSVDSFIDSL